MCGTAARSARWCTGRRDTRKNASQGISFPAPVLLSWLSARSNLAIVGVECSCALSKALSTGKMARMCCASSGLCMVWIGCVIIVRT